MIDIVLQNLQELNEKINQLPSPQRETLISSFEQLSTLLQDLATSLIQQQQAEEELKINNQKLEQKFAQQIFQVKDLEEKLKQEKNRQRRENQTLIQSEAKLQAILRHSPDILIILEPDGRIRYVSPALERILGYKPEDRVGQTFGELLHPDDISAVQSFFAQLFQNPGVAPLMTYRQRHANGSWVYVEALANSLLLDSNIEGIVMSIRDITSRQSIAKNQDTPEKDPLKATFKNAQATLQYLIKISPSAIIGIDQNGKVILWNPAAEKLFGWSKSEVLGKALPIVPTAQKDLFDSLLQSELNGGNQTGLEVTCLQKSPSLQETSLIDICYWTVPMRDSEGNIIGVLRICNQSKVEPFWVRYVRPASHPTQPH